MKRKAEKTNVGLQQSKKKKRSTSFVNEDEKRLNAELLDIKTVREGMLLLGTVIEIRCSCVMMSLPGCLVGTIPVTNICSKYTEILTKFSQSGAPEEVPLQALFNLGATLPCKVLKIKQSISKKPTITLSVNPEDVNSALKMSSLYANMVLFTAVNSVEDYGYVMETGINSVKGFLSFENIKSSELLHIGQIVPTFINKLPNQKSTGGIISLTFLSYEDTFPVVSHDDIKISSLLPGARVNAYISEISETFLYLKCLNFEAFSSALTIHHSLKKIKEVSEVSATVLYVHPVTNVLYLHLGPLPTPSTYGKFFTVQKYDKIKNVKFLCTLQNKLFFKCDKRMGYVKSNDVSRKSSLSYESLKNNPVVPKARVVFLHYMDNLIQLTLKENLLRMKIVKPEDVKIGDIYEATVKKHVEDGMFVSICPGLSGFVRQIFFSDSINSQPEKLRPVGSQVKCRVLSQNPNLGLALTCKESLMDSSSLLDNLEKAVKGQAFKGVIVKKTAEYILVLFFNNVQGIVSAENVPNSSRFYIGQTVNCFVMSCNPIKKKLKLSLNPEMLSVKHHELINAKKQKLPPKTTNKSSNAINGTKKTISDYVDVSDAEVQLSANDITSSSFCEGKTYKAIVKKITAHQLNVIVNGTARGRIHITQTGCSNEGEFPLKNFVVGQCIEVFVLTSYEKRRQNYLSITHQSMTFFLECSMIYPSTLPSKKSFKCSKLRIGFLKEVYPTFALVWLSPYHCGKLDFVNVSANPKTLRKLKKKLKVGQSLKVTAFSHFASSDECGDIKLAKPEISAPDVGRNVVGLLKVGSPDRKLVLKLPFEYIGFVHLTDIQDVYTDLQPVLEKLLKLKFILCHVLSVNHDKKSCHLSLRKSRLYNENLKCIANSSPELSLKMIEQGKIVKGYIKSLFNSDIIVNIGRNVYGKVTLRKCSKYECVNCQQINEATKTFSVGNVVEVIIDDIIPKKGFIPLSLTFVSNVVCSDDNALTVGTDINWNELV